MIATALAGQDRILEARLPIRFRWQAEAARIVFETPARFIVFVLGRRSGKTTLLADLAGEAALEDHPNLPKGDVFWGAPTYDISDVGREKFSEFWKPACLKGPTESKPPSAILYNGSKISWRSFDRPGAALGRGTSLAVIDESARVKTSIIREELLPTIADTGGKVVQITTPRGRRNLAHQWFLKAKSGDPRYAAVHGPSTANPSPKIREFIRDARDEMTDPLFRQEILAEFLEGEGVVFRNIAACAMLESFRDKPENGDDYVVGADVAKHVDYTVLTAMHIESGEVHGYDRFNKLDWPTQERRIKAFGETWNEAEVWLDSTGVGDPIFDHLAEAEVEVVGTKFTNETKSRLITALATALDKETISFPDEDEIVGELEAYDYQILPSGKFRYSAPEGMHDDIVISLALATYGRNRAATGVPV